MPGCANHMPVPGGDDTINKHFYDTNDALLRALDRLKPGMSKERVFSALQRQENDFLELNRIEIIEALYGGSEVELNWDLRRQQPDGHLLQSLHGYKFMYKNVEREHGFTSPIRMKTYETGYSYTVYLIFKDNVLFEKPILSGGLINSTSSGRIFDYLNPGMILRSPF